MPQTPPAPIVVGLDGSAASSAALRWAAAEASAHGVPLVVVHVHDPRENQRAHYARVPAQAEGSDDEAAAIDQLDRAGLTQRVERVFEVGVPSEVLVRQATGARMLVLGHAGHHRRQDDEPFRHGPALGPIARACVARATCVVVVVPIPVRLPAPDTAAPAAQRVSDLVGARALYPRVRATSVVRS
jgi:nucleotide-binding universal stress UspA family protein